MVEPNNKIKLAPEIEDMLYVLKPLDEFIEKVLEHTDDGVDCLKDVRKEIWKRLYEKYS